MSVGREDFQELLGGDSLALRMMRVLSKALRALGVRFASVEKVQDSGARVRTEAYELSQCHAGGAPCHARAAAGRAVGAVA